MAAMSEAPKRRWFRWSLRTMFVVVTVVAVLLGWELKFIRERHEFLRHTVYPFLNHDRGILLVPIKPAWEQPRVTIPFWREWLGDEAHWAIYLPHASEEDRRRAALLFPEARIYPAP